ncbi:XRE family transcriptional regulator [Burkholderia thailandensis]|nr:XRE family transcriptional regulator [Burkholderia thailandensis]MCS6429064.1 XRE family transcriptional regulator [Burkholderia thailandensis]MCS6451563.1 XRE family transcriptional regulator [Burkholderia thailandensis]MCS6463650.1 XRE family transcriptional regulator [Burkholderia thailandensis]MCS6484167.1 XRE family transcriptional regulator [Burkholderia thailandensis]MCS6486803.1 XRE family transcriptional regulator [Burkholderia thailandensis]
MERIEFINPDRIAWCCADRRITPDELASELNIAPATIDGVVQGRVGMTFNQLSKVATYFGRGVLFFLEPGPVNEEAVHSSAFRTLANQKPELSGKLKGLIERVERQRDIYVSLREDLDEAALPAFAPPALPDDDPPEAARIVRDWLRLGETNDFDSYRSAVESRGILVFRSNGYGGKWQIAKESPILGFSIYDAECPVIVVKKQFWESRQCFTLMHELGHLLLHRDSSIDDQQDMSSYQGREREANAFAGHLLVPDGLLALVDDGARPQNVGDFDSWLQPWRRAWGVSGEVILRRLMDSGRLAQHQYQAYREWSENLPIVQDDGGTRKYRHREPKHIFGDYFVRAVLDSLNARNISLARASSYLDGLKINDLHQLEQYYAGV